MRKNIYKPDIGKRLVFRICKEFSKLNVKKKKKLNSKNTNNPVRKWTKDMKRQFMEDIHTYTLQIRM